MLGPEGGQWLCNVNDRQSGTRDKTHFSPGWAQMGGLIRRKVVKSAAPVEITVPPSVPGHDHRLWTNSAKVKRGRQIAAVRSTSFSPELGYADRRVGVESIQHSRMMRRLHDTSGARPIRLVMLANGMGRVRSFPLESPIEHLSSRVARDAHGGVANAGLRIAPFSSASRCSYPDRLRRGSSIGDPEGIEQMRPIASLQDDEGTSSENRPQEHT